MFLTYFNDGIAILLSIVCILATLGLGYFILFILRKEQKRYRDEVANYIEGVESKREIIADVNAYISRSVSAEFTLLFIDLDKFTSVVENFGHEEADRIIKGLAAKLLTVLPTRVQLGRIKEDQFIVFARGEYSREEMVRLAKKILETVASPMKVYDESNLSMTCSIGICYYPTHGRSFKELFESLEIACYICKRNGGNQYRIYSKEATQDEGANMEYYYQIKDGIKNKEFDLYFQPMIDGNTKEVFAIEGLLRWNHPELGLLSPYKFINIMEQTGDINWVGLWGLETLVKEFVVLRKRFSKDFKMSLNLSPKQLANPTLASDFQKVVKKYRIQAKSIILEIEEFAIFEKHEQIQNNLKQLSELGFEIAVDGFGLDYKTLKKLEDNAVDVVKLDKEYLDNENDQYLKEKFIGILVDFARNQKRILVCEGIEDAEYLARAKEMGLEIFQGYHFAKPMSSVDIENYLANRNWIQKLEEKPSDIEVNKDEVEEVETTETVENDKNETTEETSNDVITNDESNTLEDVTEVKETKVKKEKASKEKKTTSKPVKEAKKAKGKDVVKEEVVTQDVQEASNVNETISEDNNTNNDSNVTDVDNEVTKEGIKVEDKQDEETVSNEDEKENKEQNQENQVTQNNTNE